MSNVRLYVEQDLIDGGEVEVEGPQSHYLQNVLRLGTGDSVYLFNGWDGEWRGIIDTVGKRSCSISLSECVRDQTLDIDLWLVFAPVKRARIDFIAAKATELGVSALVPVLTEHTAVSRVNVDRLRANAVEAAEQCGRLGIPQIHRTTTLNSLLENWPTERRLLVCDETGTGMPIAAALRELSPGERRAPWAVLVGPEGGFSASELDLLAEKLIVTRVGLGPRILRADTAAVAALSCWQAILGDWQRH
jgi:16S rRNA (uracil1498-N3)-methyltransferase